MAHSTCRVAAHQLRNTAPHEWRSKTCETLHVKQSQPDHRCHIQPISSYVTTLGTLHPDTWVCTSKPICRRCSLQLCWFHSLCTQQGSKIFWGVEELYPKFAVGTFVDWPPNNQLITIERHHKNVIVTVQMFCHLVQPSDLLLLLQVNDTIVTLNTASG